MMENYNMILETLKEYTTDELFYKEYYYARTSSNPNDMAAFLSRHTLAEINSRYLICPELYGKTLETIENVYLDEQTTNSHDTFAVIYSGQPNFGVMDSKHNVRIQKHNRYSPFFLHSHEYFEAFYVLTGSCTHFISDNQERLQKGTLCFISPGIKHKIEVLDDSIILNIMIQKSTFHDIFFNIIRSQTILSHFFLDSLTEKNNISHLTFLVDDRELEEVLLSMYLEEMVEDSYTNKLLSLQLSLFFMKLVRKYERIASLHLLNDSSSSDRFDMLSYINDHYKTVTLNSLAEYFHYTPEHCSRLIRHTTGQTFLSLLKSIRLSRAETLLLNTGLSVEEISHLIGYENSCTLISLFKKKNHVTPGEFRKNANRQIHPQE